MSGTGRAEENFRRALLRLEEFLALPQDQAVVETAVAKAFEMALRLGILPAGDEAAWLDMPKTRNLAAHVYLPDVCRQVVRRVRQRFLPAFQRLREGLDCAR